MIHDTLQHDLILNVVFDQQVIDFLLDLHTSCITDLEAFHAESATNYRQDLRLLVANIDHDTRVETTDVQGCHVAKYEVHILAIELLEAHVSNSFIEWPQTHEGLNDDDGLLLWIGL